MLTNDEIDTLIEALNALQKQQGRTVFTSILLSAILSKPEDKEAWEADSKRKMEEAQQQEKGTEERVILLKAKLIGMRDKALVEEMRAHLLTG